MLLVSGAASRSQREALTSPSFDLPPKKYRSPSLRFELEKKFERDLWVSLTNSQSLLLNNYLFRVTEGKITVNV